MLTPRPYQEEAIAKGSETNLIIGDECGAGKTLDAIEIIRRIQQRPEFPEPALVVVRNLAREQWLNAVHYQGLIAQGGSRYWIPPLRPKDILIISYEDLLHKPTLAILQSIFWSVVVLDEAHQIKNRKTQRRKAVQSLRAYRRLCLTGTPLERKISDLWSLLNWVAPDDFASFWKFEQLYCEYEDNWAGFPQYKGPKNMDLFAANTKPWFIQRTKAEVAPQLPEKIVIDVPLTLRDDQYELYRAIRDAKDIEVKLPDSADAAYLLEPLLVKNTLAKIIKLQQTLSCPWIFQDGLESVKTQWIKEYIEDNPSESIVIFTRFRETAMHLGDLLGGVLLVGGSEPVDLTKHPPLIIGTIASMSESLDFHWIKTAIFVDLEWSTIKMTQAVDRIHRINITEPKNIVYLRCSQTVDNLIRTALDAKWTDQQLVYSYLKHEPFEI